MLLSCKTTFPQNIPMSWLRRRLGNREPVELLKISLETAAYDEGIAHNDVH